MNGSADSRIPYTRPSWGKEELHALQRVLESGLWTTGPANVELERGLAELLGGGEAVTVANGTLALYALLRLLRGRGSEGRWLYVSSSLNFSAGAATARLCGYDVALCDISTTTLNLDANSLETLLRRVRRNYEQVVVNPVLFAGRADGIADIADVASRYDCHVVEDACHALGAFAGKRHRRPDEQAIANVFSFHGTKNVAAGEGGAIWCRDPELASKLRLLRNQGIDRRHAGPTADDMGVWHYDIDEPGLNLRLSEFQAAIAGVQLGRLAAGALARQRIAERYVQTLPKGVSHFAPAQPTESAYHLFPIALPVRGPSRRLVFERLNERNIHPQVHYIPLHRQGAFKDLPLVRDGDYSNLEAVADRLLSLPMYPDLSEPEQGRVIRALQDAVDEV